MSARLVAVLALFVACAPEAVPTLKTRGLADSACTVDLVRIDYNQAGVDDGAVEAVELAITGAADGATVSSCGVTKVIPVAGSTCAADPPSHVVDVGAVVVPPSGLVLTGRANGIANALATTAIGSGTWLRNGPDYVVLANDDGPVTAYAIVSTGHVVPTCSAYSAAISLPIDADEKDGGPHAIVRCDEGDYRWLALADSPYGTAPDCPVLAGGAAGNPTVGVAGGGDGGASGSGGAPIATCRARFDKVDVSQPTVLGGDTREAIELVVDGEGSTLGDCGVRLLVPFNASTDGVKSPCGSAAGPYGEVLVDGVVIPPSRRVIIGNRAGAALPLLAADGSPIAALQNGPDSILLENTNGLVLAGVSYPSAAKPLVWASCEDAEPSERIPAGESATAPTNRVVVRCVDDSWAAVDDDDALWGAPASCPSALSSTGDAGASDAGPVPTATAEAIASATAAAPKSATSATFTVAYDGVHASPPPPTTATCAFAIEPNTAGLSVFAIALACYFARTHAAARPQAAARRKRGVGAVTRA